MKMPDGGYRPAYNVQFGTDGGARVIVSVDVTNSGSDRGQMAPLHDDIVTRYGHTPQHYAVDGGFATKEDITTVEQRGSQILAPIHGEARMRSNSRRSTHAEQFTAKIACGAKAKTPTPVNAAIPTKPSRSDNAWPSRTRKRSTNSVRRSPNSPTRNAATEACNNFAFAACRR